MKEIDKQTVHYVENCVCEYFKLEYEEVIINKSRKRDYSNARQIIISILHDVFAYSISAISSYYEFDARWVKQICSNVRSSCRIYKEYKKHYDVITTVLLDLDYFQ